MTDSALALDSPAHRLVGAFLSGRNARTTRAYRQDLDDFRSHLNAATAEAAVARLLGAGAGDANALVLDYRNALVGRGLAVATVNRRLAAVRSVVKLGRTLGLVPWSVEIAGLKAEPYRDTRGPGDDGVRRLLGQLDGRTDAKGIRDRAVLRLLYDLGLRRGELVALDLADVDVATGTVAVLGKGRTGKVALTLPDATQTALVAWIAVRGSAPGPLFVNLDHAHHFHRLDGRSVHRLVRTLGQAAGLAVRPHGLRHAAITAALGLTNGNVQAVARFSRHRDLRTVLRYDDNRTDLGGDVARRVAAGV